MYDSKIQALMSPQRAHNWSNFHEIGTSTRNQIYFLHVSILSFKYQASGFAANKEVYQPAPFRIMATKLTR
jgi:hypothetical protein